MKRFYLIITILFVGVSALWSQHANVIWNILPVVILLNLCLAVVEILG